ncbi:hypothetical protein L228DRAFT_145982 [Xylona heveae TC161]|uniref:C2H2-type domain-containing protein n=1 Tax=Xylona heveae (strain CBS 132557 / TC161) TaxID=1328760 RepID=A0A165GE29_XYLHT|nr:hypothetical protein L228DRAFT_145982 [Xylona heveae TC161]KZF22080.1 hypothetical protein L228DRAFT_145982 [Xylona heveae TC161]
MAGTASPIDIATPTRNSSSSPSNLNPQPSNLTTALQGAAAREARPTPAVNIGAPNSHDFASNAGRRESVAGSLGGMGSHQWGTGAKPISMSNANRDKTRRESLAGSLVGGMSWGGVSVGSWIRDDIIMAGTSPFTYQSPSFHSSSYLPKLEANFMRDFSCCGITLASLHDLLQHYEEAHAQQVPPSQRPSQSGQGAGPNGLINRGQTPQHLQPPNPHQQSRPGQSNHATPTGMPLGGPVNGQQTQNGFGKPLTVTHELDAVEDMEMDDVDGNDATPSPSGQPQQAQQSQFGQNNSSRVPSLSLNITNAMQSHQGLKSSRPSTPAAAGAPGFPFQNNPTVSSVNTPTFGAQPMRANSPDSSVPGTPAELDSDFVGGLPGDLPMAGNPMQGGNGMFGYNFGNGNEMLDLCIDEPAKRLFSPNGGFSNQHHLAQFRMGGAQYGSELARRIREQQLLAGLSGAAPGMLPGEEIKPFRCPVVGCEKAYKNQNGLKYHKTHGHTNQQLHENPDGTFSIVNPETSVPYPGTLGMEKEKPYRCEVCGKRYKNLNGLKYHKAHAPLCHPDLKVNAAALAGSPLGMQGVNVNVAGAGLAGIGEENMVQ